MAGMGAGHVVLGSSSANTAGTTSATLSVPQVEAKVDPALVSAPLISTLVDTTGLIIFYSIAIVLLIKMA